MADAGVSDKFFEVRLDHGDERAIDNADDGQSADPLGGTMRGVGKKRQAEANHAVGAHFEQHSGEHDGAGGGCFHVGVRQPSVQREQGNFDGKGEKEGQEQEHFLGASEHDLASLQGLLDGGQVKGAGDVVEPDDADEHQDGASHGVEHELDGGVDAALVSPDANEEGHGNEHDFPEKEKEKEVQGKKHADDADLEHQEHDEKFLDARLDAGPGGKHGDDGQEGSEDDQKEADAVESQVVVDGWNIDPLGELFELIAGDTDLHFGNEQQGKEELHEGDGEREAANP